MRKISISFILLISITSILSYPASTSASTVIGITYTSSSTSATGAALPSLTPAIGDALPPPLFSEAAASKLRFRAVRLVNPHPDVIRAFAFTNASLLLAIPNGFLPPLASHRSVAVHWIRVHVLAFYPRTKIAMISVGDDVSGMDFDSLMPAVRNIHSALQELGLRTISVSCTFSFVDIITTAIPPSAAAFQEPIGEAVIRPLLRFLKSTNSSFSVSVYPYQLYRMQTQAPPGLKYGNPLEMMIDAVFSALAVAGHQDLPLIVAETGSTADSVPNPAYAEVYLRSLLAYLASGERTPLSNVVAQAYINFSEPEFGSYPSDSDLDTPGHWKKTTVLTAVLTMAVGVGTLALVIWVFYVSMTPLRSGSIDRGRKE